METAVLTVELIFFILVTLFMVYMAINIIISDLKSRKKRKQLDESINKFCQKISNAVITAGKVEAENNNETKKENKKSKINYEDMPLVELYKVARKLKIKGYYKLHKNELIKAIRETEIIPE